MSARGGDRAPAGRARAAATRPRADCLRVRLVKRSLADGRRGSEPRRAPWLAGRARRLCGLRLRRTTPGFAQPAAGRRARAGRRRRCDGWGSATSPSRVASGACVSQIGVRGDFFRFFDVLRRLAVPARGRRFGKPQVKASPTNPHILQEGGRGASKARNRPRKLKESKKIATNSGFSDAGEVGAGPGRAAGGGARPAGALRWWRLSRGLRAPSWRKRRVLHGFRVADAEIG